MKKARAGHPSGRPEREHKRGTETYRRIPRDEPLTPRLRLRELQPAIGFTVGNYTEIEED